MTPAPKIRVAIIDDQVLFTEGLSQLLRTFNFIQSVQIINKPNLAMLPLSLTNYDVLLLDINMPQKSGLILCAEIKKLYPNQKIIFLSVREDRITIEKAIAVGGDGYIFKNANRDEFETIICKVMRGENFFMGHRKSSSVYTFSDGSALKLTKREIEFLEYLLAEMTSKEIARSMFISEHTAITYRKILFKKFNVNNILGLAKYAMELFSM